MPGNDLRTAADDHLVHVAFYQNVPMAVGPRHRVVVGPVPHQGQGTHPARPLVAGVVGHCRQGQQGLQIPVQPLADGLGSPLNRESNRSRQRRSRWARMSQRDEHLLGPEAAFPHVVLDYGVLALEPVLIPQPLEDAPGSVALLPGHAKVALQDRVDDAGEGLQLGAAGRILPPAARRDRVGGHLAHRVPVQAERPGCLPDAHPIDHHRSPDPQVHFHSIHPPHHP